MVRREFLAGLPVLPALAADRQSADTSAATKMQIYEWREYSLRTGTQPRRLADYLQNALIPALNRHGHSPIGVFEVTFGLPSPTVIVLTPFSSADAMAAKESLLDKDEAFGRAAAAYHDAAATDAV